MTEHQRQAAERPAAERYYAQYAALGLGTESSAQEALQEAINEGASQSWKLIGVTKDPASEGTFLVWDTSGFFSG